MGQNQIALNFCGPLRKFWHVPIHNWDIPYIYIHTIDSTYYIIYIYIYGVILCNTLIGHWEQGRNPQVVRTVQPFENRWDATPKWFELFNHLRIGAFTWGVHLSTSKNGNLAWVGQQEKGLEQSKSVDFSGVDQQTCEFAMIYPQAGNLATRKDPTKNSGLRKRWHPKIKIPWLVEQSSHDIHRPKP